MASIDHVVQFFRQLPGLLRGVHRWTPMKTLPREECETVETHSLVSVWLVGAMLAIERAHGTHKLNEARLLLGASLHDVGEGRIGDVAYLVKNDPRVRGQLVAIEHEAVARDFANFPPTIRDAFSDAYAVEREIDETPDGEFFHAVEVLGYMLFAVPQVKQGRLEFRAVLEHHHGTLVKYSSRFESVRVFYEPYRRYVELILNPTSAETPAATHA